MHNQLIIQTLSFFVRELVRFMIDFLLLFVSSLGLFLVEKKRGPKREREKPTIEMIKHCIAANEQKAKEKRDEAITTTKRESSNRDRLLLFNVYMADLSLWRVVL